MMNMKNWIALTTMTIFASVHGQRQCDDVVAKIPECALSCLADAANSSGCKSGDLACQCYPATMEAIGRSALGCVLEACGAEKGLGAKSAAEQVCSCAATAFPVLALPTSASSIASFAVPSSELISPTGALPTASSVEDLQTSKSSQTPAKTSNVMTSSAITSSSSSLINFPNDQTTRSTASTGPSLAATSSPAQTVLSGAAIGGIATGGAVFLLTVAIIIIATYYFRQRRKQTRSVPLPPETVYAETVDKEADIQYQTELESPNQIRSPVQEMPTRTPHRGPWELQGGGRQ